MCRSVNQAAGLKERWGAKGHMFVIGSALTMIHAEEKQRRWCWAFVWRVWGAWGRGGGGGGGGKDTKVVLCNQHHVSHGWGVGGFYWISVSDNPNLRERRLTVTWLCVSLMKRPQMTHLLYVWYINYTTHILGSFCLASLCIYPQIGSKWLQFLIRGPTNVCMETSLPPSNKNTAFNIFQTYFLIKILHLNYNIIENHYTFCSQRNVFNHILI